MQMNFFTVAPAAVGLQLRFDTSGLSVPFSVAPVVLKADGSVERFKDLHELAAVLVCENLTPQRLPSHHGCSDLVQLPAYLWYELQLLMTKCMQREC